MTESSKKELPRLFHEDVVWDSSRLRVVKLMSEAESRSVARFSSRNLHNSSAAILHAFASFAEIRSTNAQLDVRELLASHDDEDASKEPDDEYSLRRKEIAEESLDQIYQTVEQYRREAGYRVLCLLAMSAEAGHSIDTVQAASGIRLLGRAQSAHIETLMLVEKIKFLNKFKTAGNEVAFGKERLIQTQLLDCHVATVTQVFKKIHAPILENGAERLVYDVYQYLVDTHQEWSETNLSDLRAAESAVQTFRITNIHFTKQLSSVIDAYTYEHFNEGKVFPRVA